VRTSIKRSKPVTKLESEVIDAPMYGDIFGREASQNRQSGKGSKRE
jgi:hypothetical protein